MVRWKRYLRRDFWSNNLILAGLLFSLVYWCLESALHVYVFKEGGMAQQLLKPDSHELWMRLMVIGLMIGFSFFGQSLLITRRRAEAALQRREREANDILENNPAGIVLVDAETRRIEWVNSNALQMTRNQRENLVGCVCHDHLCPSERGHCPVLDLGQPLDRSERTLLASDGSEVPILKSATQVTYRDRPHLLEAFFDISAQKEMRQAIKTAHAELDQIFQTISVGLRLVDRNFSILKVNETFARLSGIAVHAAVGRKCYEVFGGDQCHTPDCPLKQILDGRPAAECQIDKRMSDGTVVPCVLRSTPFRDPDGEIVGIVESFQDVTALKATQEELRSERDKLHRILFKQFECVAILNPDKDIEFQNETSELLFPGAVGQKCYAVYHRRETPCPDCHMEIAIASGMIQRSESDTADMVTFEQTYTPFLDSDGRRKVVLSFRDVTEERASRLAAMHSERLAAIGELAAGVAHEINNPINGIINYAQIVINKSRDSGFIRDVSRRILKEGDRIAAIVESLLSFARQDDEGRTVVTLGEVLKETMTLTSAQLRKDGIRVVMDLAVDLPPVFVQTQKLQQVFVNLISNARYALKQRTPPLEGGPELRVVARELFGSGQPQVRIEFVDNGIGIPADVIDKILNPFFSTKPKGIGTGLGLSISHGIVRDHGGTLAVESKEGEFTRLTIDLPAAASNGENRIAS